MMVWKEKNILLYNWTPLKQLRHPVLCDYCTMIGEYCPEYNIMILPFYGEQNFFNISAITLLLYYRALNPIP